MLEDQRAFSVTETSISLSLAGAASLKGGTGLLQLDDTD